MVHLIPINTMTKASELVLLYVKEVVHLHRLPDSIVSDKDSKFTSMFWHETRQILGTKLLMSTLFHPQMDGATEQVNRSIGQILRTLILSNQSDWVDKLPLTEFAINSNISSSTGFAPFKLNHGYMPSLIGGIMPFENAKPGIKRFINQALTNLGMAHDAIIESQVNQTQQSNKWQKAETPFAVGDKVYLSNPNLNLPKSRARKLMPKFIGPYKVTNSHSEILRYSDFQN